MIFQWGGSGPPVPPPSGLTHVYEASVDSVVSSERITKGLIRLHIPCHCCPHATESGLLMSRPVSYYVHDRAFKVHASMVQMTFESKIAIIF